MTSAESMHAITAMHDFIEPIVERRQERERKNGQLNNEVVI